MQEDGLQERLLTAWVGINSFFKDSRMTQDLTYNEAVVMKLAYDQYRRDGIGRVSMQAVQKGANMLKSLANRTVNALCDQGYLVRERNGRDGRTVFLRIVPERLPGFLAVHKRSLHIAQAVIDAIGEEDAEQFVRICEKFIGLDIQIE